MVKLVVLYGQPTDEAAFDDHYTSVHAPLVDAIPGLGGFEHGKVQPGPDGSPAPYYYLAELRFDDAAAMQSAMGGPEGAAAGADVPTFATGGVTMLVAES